MNAQVTPDTLYVGEGWNMIGPSSTGTPSQILRSEPSDIIVSSFFKYNPGGGYEAKDTLEKGKGYWVKVNTDGMIIFYDSGSSCPGIPTVETSRLRMI